MFTYKIHFSIAAVGAAAIVYARCQASALEWFAKEYPGVVVEFVTLTLNPVH